jgi:predicted lipid-binding transport protein (Tim44 family)
MGTHKRSESTQRTENTQPQWKHTSELTAKTTTRTTTAATTRAASANQRLGRAVSSWAGQSLAGCFGLGLMSWFWLDVSVLYLGLGLVLVWVARRSSEARHFWVGSLGLCCSGSRAGHQG